MWALFLSPKGGILSGLSERCRSHALDVANVEYRFCRVITLGPVLDRIRNGLSTCHDSLCATHETNISSLSDEIMRTIKEIRAYDDGAVLNDFYKQCTNEAERCIADLSFPRSCGMTVADYISRHVKDEQRLGQIKYLFTFDSSLVDSKLIHMVVNEQHKHKVVALAGGAHINAVCQLLKNIGYESIYTASSVSDVPLSMRTSVQSSGACAQEQRPLPIDMGFLRRYLDVVN